jgi:signal transduction histidine kinase
MARFDHRMLRDRVSMAFSAVRAAAFPGWAADPAAMQRVSQARLALDQLRLVAQNMRPIAFLIPVMSAIITVMFSSWVAWPWLLFWYALALAGVAPLAVVSRQFLRREHAEGTAPRWVMRFTAAVFFFALTWGSMGLLLWVPDSDLDHALIILIIGSTLAGNSVLAGAHRQVAGTAFVLYGLVMVLAPLRSGGIAYYGLAAVAALYIGFLYYMAQVYHSVALDMLLLREERRALVERLSKEVADLRAAELRQKETERQLLHSQKLEAIGTLAGGIAHELNNALTPVLALTKLTADRLPEASRERANLVTVHRGAERARDLVRQILAFGRKEAGEEVFFDLRAVVRETLSLMRSTLPATVEIIEDLAKLPPLYGDPGQLHQAIVNLVTNAAQAIGTRHGRITIILARAAGDPLGSGGKAVRLSVTDTGAGMDAATAGRIFEPFFTTKPVGEGTGLGLSVVHGIVTSHGGRIEVESASGVGARLDLYLPLPRPAVAVAAP